MNRKQAITALQNDDMLYVSYYHGTKHTYHRYMIVNRVGQEHGINIHGKVKSSLLAMKDLVKVKQYLNGTKIHVDDIPTLGVGDKIERYYMLSK